MQRTCQRCDVPATVKATKLADGSRPRPHVYLCGPHGAALVDAGGVVEDIWLSEPSAAGWAIPVRDTIGAVRYVDVPSSDTASLRIRPGELLVDVDGRSFHAAAAV